MNSLLIIIIYIIFINMTSFIVMGLDKHKAKKHLWRIPESTLFILTIIGGSVGSILGMYVFRHKTRHWYFVYGFPLILLFQLAIFFFLYTSPIEFIFM